MCGQITHRISTKIIRISSKPMDITTFSLLSLTCDAKFFDLELESEKNKICWEKLRPRSLHFRGVFRISGTFQFNFPSRKIFHFAYFQFWRREPPYLWAPKTTTENPKLKFSFFGVLGQFQFLSVSFS